MKQRPDAFRGRRQSRRFGVLPGSSAAGAKRTWEATCNLFCPVGAGFSPPGDQLKILSHMLATGELDPSGDAWPGLSSLTCRHMASMTSDPASMHAILAEIARRERSEIMNASDRAGAPVKAALKRAL